MSLTKQDTRIKNSWRVILSDYVQEVEAWVRSSQRVRELSAEKLVQTLVLGCLENGNASLSDLAKVAGDLGCEIKPASLHDRLTDRVVMLLMGVLQLAIQNRVPGNRLPIERLTTFKRVVCYDSTRISLPAQFAALFADTTKGCSSLKIQLGYDYLAGQLTHLTLASGTAPDQTDVGVLQEAAVGTCLLLDAGYFKQERLRDMDKQGASFVIPLQSQTALYDPQTGEAIALDKVLKNQSGCSFEAIYRVGGRVKHPLRLIARALPQSVVDNKRRHARKRAKSEGYTPTQAYMTLLGWQIFLTNLDEDWNPRDIFLLYGIRWQIELVFKGWKSYLQLIPSGSATRRQRVFSQLLANLIGAVLCQTTFSLVRWSNFGEVSWFQTITILQRQLPTLYRVIRRQWYGFTSWVKQTRWKLLHATRPSVENVPSTLQSLMDWGLT